jgi:hypothetical protein
MNSRTFPVRIKRWTRKREEILANRSARRGYAPAWEKRSGSRGFPADNVVPFNHRGHAHPCTAVFHSALDTHHFAQGSDKNL